MEPFEADLQRCGAKHVAGIDEAGRGALFGPVLAAAVVLDPEGPVAGLNDSKQLSAARRVELFNQLQERAVDWAIGLASAAEIDQINILRASRLAMASDARCSSIAAASIVAKCVRDELIRQYGRIIRGYGLARNMGYATAEHRAAIISRGFSEIHRRTFRVQGTLPF